MKKLTTQQFIERAKNINEGYDYSKTEYVDAKTKVCITCPEHGDFYTLPHNHLAGKGCPICRYIKSASKNRRDINVLKEKCIEIHGNKYDYSLFTEYKDNRTKIPIICHCKDNCGVEHGVFYQSMEKHIDRKHGCPKCSGYIRTQETFIGDAKAVHGEMFDYSKSVYKKSHDKVLIKCNKCGNEFWQTPHDHLSGNGCPFCKMSHLEKEVMMLLENSKINFVIQYPYDKKQYKYKLDFYLPEKNIAIECQGTQHFMPVKFKGNEQIKWAEKEFKKNLRRDKKKYDKCKELGIKLYYYIPVSYKNCLCDKKFNNIYNENNVIHNIEDFISKI